MRKVAALTPTGGDASCGPFERIAKASLSQQTYQQIRTLLMQSRLQPGRRLILRTLAAEFGVSPTPVREALLRLVSEQALTLDERGTVMVPTLDLARYLEIRDLRAGLESEAAYRAAAYATAADIKTLKSIHERLLACSKAGDYATALEHNQRFHLGVCRLARSPVLLGIIEGLWMQCGPILSNLWTTGIKVDTSAHLDVLAGLGKGDGEQARRAMTADIIAGGAPLLHQFPGADLADTEGLAVPRNLWRGRHAVSLPTPSPVVVPRSRRTRKS